MSGRRMCWRELGGRVMGRRVMWWKELGGRVRGGG